MWIEWEIQVVEDLEALIIKEERGNGMAMLEYRCG
jgi:hypothetical protein